MTDLNKVKIVDHCDDILRMEDHLEASNVDPVLNRIIEGSSESCKNNLAKCASTHTYNNGITIDLEK